MNTEIRTYVLRQQDGEIIQPWKDIKDLRAFEWIRNAPDAVAPETREILEATYVDVQKVPIVIMGERTKVAINGKEMDEYEAAVFQDNTNGRVYDISKRCADKRKVKLHDTVKLHMLGCCNIMDIKKISTTTPKAAVAKTKTKTKKK